MRASRRRVSEADSSGARQERAIRSRALIIERAARAFARDGYEGASLNRIIAETKLTKGAFYFHFRSKDELALAVFRAKQAQLIDHLRAAAGAQPNALLALVAMVRTRARLLQSDPSLGCFLRLASELGTRFGPTSEFAASYEIPLRTLTELVRRGQREGVFHASLDARAAGEALFAVILGTDGLSRVITGGANIASRTESSLALILTALAPTRGRPRNRPAD